MSSKPLACWICGKEINLNNCNTDERGLPVHGPCMWRGLLPSRISNLHFVNNKRVARVRSYFALAQRGNLCHTVPRHARPSPVRWTTVHCLQEIWSGSHHGWVYAMRREILYTFDVTEGSY